MRVVEYPALVAFVCRLLNQLFPDEMNGTLDGSKFYAEKCEGKSLSSRAIQGLDNLELKIRANVIDYIMRLCGQGGSNLRLHDGKIYTKWDAFSRDHQLSRFLGDPIMVIYYLKDSQVDIDFILKQVWRDYEPCLVTEKRAALLYAF